MMNYRVSWIDIDDVLILAQGPTFASKLLIVITSINVKRDDLLKWD